PDREGAPSFRRSLRAGAGPFGGCPTGQDPPRDRLRCRRPHRERDAGAGPPPRARHAGAPPRVPRSRSPADGIGGTERRVSLQRVAPRGRSARTRRCEVGRGWSPEPAHGPRHTRPDAQAPSAQPVATAATIGSTTVITRALSTMAALD